MIFPTQVTRIALPILLLLSCTAAADAAARTPPPAEPPVERLLARELARLDSELGLGSFPGGGPWTARLAAALERRLSQADPWAAPAPELMRHLAAQLRGLGPERELVDTPLSAERADRLRRLLDTTRLLRTKLARLQRTESARHRIVARAAPSNDSCAGAAGVGLGTVTGSTGEANDFGSASCGNSNSSPDVWFVYTANATGAVSFDTFGSSFDTVLSLVDRCPGDGRDEELACNDDAAGTTRSRIILEMTEGQNVWIRLSGSAGASGPFELTLADARGISGIVTHAGSGNPLPGVELDLFDDGGVVATTATDSDGSYFLGHVSSGTYRVGARGAPELVDELYDDVPCIGLISCLDGATPIEVAGSLITGIDLALDSAGKISGTVTDNSTSSGLAEAFVSLYDVDGNHLETVQCEADGSYEIGGLPAGGYHLLSDADGFRAEVYDDLPCEPDCTVTDGTRVSVASGAMVTGVDFGLDRLGSLTGTVTDELSGVPAEHVRVLLYLASGAFHGSDFTDADGDYAFGGLLPGTYHVRTDAFGYRDELYDDLPCEPSCDPTTGTPVTVDVNATKGGIDFGLLPLGRISGTVTHHLTGLPLEDILVEARDPVTFAGGIDRTGADGSYQVDALVDGTYYVRTREPDTYANELYDDLPCSDSCDLTRGTPFVMAPGVAVTGVDFAIAEWGQLTGTLTEAGSGLPIPGRVLLFDSTGSFVEGVHAGTDGTYRFFELYADTYFAETRVSNHLDELYDDLPLSNDRTEGTPIVVGVASTVTGIDFALERLGEIRGNVVEALSGLPVQSGSVAAYETSGVKRGEGLILDDGSYQISGLRPRTYHVVAHSPTHRDELHDDLPCPATCDVTAGTPFEIEFGTAVTGVDFTLDRLGAIAGTIKAADTGSFLFAFARLHRGDGSFADSEASDASGYRFENLEPGTYYVKSSRSSFFSDDYQDELYRDVPCEPTCDFSLGTPLQVNLNSSILGVDLVLHRCPGRSFETVTGTTFLSVHSVAACERVTAHSGTTVGSGADVTFAAGRTVVLGDGFSVLSGASFEAVIEPAWAED